MENVWVVVIKHAGCDTPHHVFTSMEIMRRRFIDYNLVRHNLCEFRIYERGNDNPIGAAFLTGVDD